MPSSFILFLKLKLICVLNLIDLREILDIKDFLKETTSALKLRFDCSMMLFLE
jgi:hypothetical protein